MKSETVQLTSLKKKIMIEKWFVENLPFNTDPEGEFEGISVPTCQIAYFQINLYLKCICVTDDVITSVEGDWVAATAFVFARFGLLLATQFKVIVD